MAIFVKSNYGLVQTMGDVVVRSSIESVFIYGGCAVAGDPEVTWSCMVCCQSLIKKKILC